MSSCPNTSLPLYQELKERFNEDTMLAIHALIESPEFIAWKGDTELPKYISSANVFKNNKGEYLKLDKFINNFNTSYSVAPKNNAQYVDNINSLLKDRLKTLKKSQYKIIKELKLNREKLTPEELSKKIAKVNLDYIDQIKNLNKNIELIEEDPNVNNISLIANEQLSYIEDALKTPGLKASELQLYKNYLDVWSIINTDDIFEPEILQNLTDEAKAQLTLIAGKAQLLINDWFIIAKNTLIQDIKNKTTFSDLSQITIEKVLDTFLDEGSVTAYGQDLSSVSNFLAQHIDKYLKDAKNVTQAEFKQLNANFTRVFKGVNNKADFILNSEGNLLTEFAESFYVAQKAAKEKLKKELLAAKNVKDDPTGKKKFKIIDKAYSDYSDWINTNKFIIDPRRINDPKLLKELTAEYGKEQAEKLLERVKEGIDKWEEDLEAYKENLDLKGLSEDLKEDALIKFDLENNPQYYAERYIDGITKTDPVLASIHNTGWKYIVNSPRKFKADIKHEWVKKGEDNYYQRKNIITKTDKLTGYYDEKYEALNNQLSSKDKKELIELIKSKKQSERLFELEKKAPQLAFYLFWKYNMRELFDNIPDVYKEDINANMMPNLKKDLLATLAQGDFKGGWQALTDNMISMLLSPEYDEVNTERDVVTGEIKSSIPVKYLTPIKENKENRLDVIFNHFALMSLNYKNKSAVQDIVELGAKILYEAKIIQTNGSTPLMSGNNILTVKNGEAKIKRMVKYQIEANLYGKTKKDENWGNTGIHVKGSNLAKKLLNNEKITNDDLIKLTSKKKQRALQIQESYLKIQKELEDTTLTPEQRKKKEDQQKKHLTEITKLTGGNLDVVEVLDANIRLTALKVLGYNPVSAVINSGFGVIGNFIHAAGEQEFTRKQALKAFGLLVSSMKLGISFNDKLRTKITKLMDLYDLESNDLYGTSTTKWSLLNPYELMRRGDYLIKGQTMIATMMNTKVGNKSLWEMYDDEGNFIEDNPQWSNGDLNTEMQEFKKFQNKVQGISQIIHGDFNNPKMLNATIAGRLVSQFRLSWMAEGISDRFREEYYNERLGRTVKGRWRTGFTIAKDEGLLKLLGRIAKTATFQKSGLEGLSETDKANFKKNMTELYIVTSLTLLILMLKGAGDDDKDKKQYTFLINQLQRLDNDLFFYADPGTFESITKSFIPSLKTYTDTKKALKATYKYMTKDGKRYDEEYLFMNWARVFPITNQIPKIKYQSSKILTTE